MIEWQVLASHIRVRIHHVAILSVLKSDTPDELHVGVHGVSAMETWLAIGRPPIAICRPRVVLAICMNE